MGGGESEQPVTWVYVSDGPAPVMPARRVPLASRSLASWLLVLGGVLSIAGSFGTLVRVAVRVQGNEVLSIVANPWGVVYRAGNSQELSRGVPKLGVPLVLAGVLAIVFGVLVASRYRHSSWPRAAAAASAGVLFGVLLTIGFNAAGYREWVVGPAHFDQVLTVGPGGYVLALAALSAIVAAVLLAVVAEPVEPEVERVEPDTPVLGIPVLAPPPGTPPPGMPPPGTGPPTLPSDDT